MRTLSATDAFTPAIERTKAILRPFSLKLWLKLGLVALIAEMGMQFIFPPVGVPPHSSSSGIGASAGGVTPLHVTVFVVVGVAMAVLGLVLIYFGSRMQLVLMEMVATRSTLAQLWPQNMAVDRSQAPLFCDCYRRRGCNRRRTVDLSLPFHAGQ